jgi:hypothetical protein
MTAFSAAIDAIFADPNMAADALFYATGVAPAVTVRVIRKAPDDIREFGQSRISQPTTTIDVRVSEIPTMTEAARFQIAGAMHQVQGVPQRDRLQLVWTVDLRAV